MTAKYSIQILEIVIKKDLASIPKKDTARIMQRISMLSENPRPNWSKKLTGNEEYRARQGNYRILYTIEDVIKVVEVIRVGHRRDIYK